MLKSFVSGSLSILSGFVEFYEAHPNLTNFAVGAVSTAIGGPGKQIFKKLAGKAGEQVLETGITAFGAFVGKIVTNVAVKQKWAITLAAGSFFAGSANAMVLAPAAIGVVASGVAEMVLGLVAGMSAGHLAKGTKSLKSLLKESSSSTTLGTAADLDKPIKVVKYNRKDAYGRTPTAADRRALTAGDDQVVDHDPPLSERYYDGDPNRDGIPEMYKTQDERIESAKDRDRMRLQEKPDSNSQGGQQRAYALRKWLELNK